MVFHHIKVGSDDLVLELENVRLLPQAIAAYYGKTAPGLFDFFWIDDDGAKDLRLAPPATFGTADKPLNVVLIPRDRLAPQVSLRVTTSYFRPVQDT